MLTANGVGNKGRGQPVAGIRYKQALLSAFVHRPSQSLFAIFSIPINVQRRTDRHYVVVLRWSPGMYYLDRGVCLIALPLQCLIDKLSQPTFVPSPLRPNLFSLNTADAVGFGLNRRTSGIVRCNYGHVVVLEWN